MKTKMKELNQSEMEMVNGGSAYIYYGPDGTPYIQIIPEEPIAVNPHPFNPPTPVTPFPPIDYEEMTRMINESRTTA
jgi:hypothetical protein